MAEQNKLAATSENGELLTTKSIAIPRWTKDVWRQVCRDTDLKFSEAGRIAFVELAKHFQKHWKRGPDLRSFLEHFEFHPEQYNLFFQRRAR